MQNNITEITQKLLKSLDNNYNVINMPAVIEIISILEKVAITKELLETTRLGKYVNELRRKTTNEQLSKRAKELVKKWKSLVLPETNGQIKPAPIISSVPSEDVNLNHLKRKRQPAVDSPANVTKKPKTNGQISEHDFSDSSNSSFKDATLSKPASVLNSDSNSSFAENKTYDPLVEEQLPKKRGRKKGSKNHKNLLDEAESSFTNKLAVSRGNSKVKTTQELIASLQNKSALSLSPAKAREDLVEKAAKLTERVSIIDQTLYTNSSRYKQRKNLKLGLNDVKPLVAGSASSNDKSLIDEEIIIVDDVDGAENVVKLEPESITNDSMPDAGSNAPVSDPNFVPSLSIEEALASLPPVDLSRLEDDDGEPRCSCFLKENKPDFSVEETVENELENRFEFEEDSQCQARSFYETKYNLSEEVDSSLVARLSAECMPNVNGNYGSGRSEPAPSVQSDGLYENVVPNVYSECRLAKENYNKYSISETTPPGGGGDERTGDINTNVDRHFSEWHEVFQTPSYQGDPLTILPYVIID